MRTVTYGGATSLDMFIAGPNGALDWLHWSDDAQKIMTDYWATIDTILMGRKTYEVAIAGGGGGSDPAIRAYVFSRTLKEVPDATVVSEDAGAFVRELKARPGKGIVVMGGGELALRLVRGHRRGEEDHALQPQLAPCRGDRLDVPGVDGVEAAAEEAAGIKGNVRFLGRCGHGPPHRDNYLRRF